MLTPVYFELLAMYKWFTLTAFLSVEELVILSDWG